MEHADAQLILIATLAIYIIGPILTGLVGVIVTLKNRSVNKSTYTSRPQNWAIIINSTFLYVIAHNLTYFIQELFLVLPKALTPGLQPTLYHNNHTWSGDAAIASLFQGTGALAIVITGVISLIILATLRLKNYAVLLFLFWMAHQGFVQGLVQIPASVVAPSSDVGQAMQYLEWGRQFQNALGVAALIVLATLLIYLARALQSLAPERLVSRSERIGFSLRAALLPAIFGAGLTVLYKMPAALPDTLINLTVLNVIGIPWLIAAALPASRAFDNRMQTSTSIMVTPLLGAIALLAFFQIVLRPGIQFF